MQNRKRQRVSGITFIWFADKKNIRYGKPNEQSIMSNIGNISHRSKTNRKKQPQTNNKQKRKQKQNIKKKPNPFPPPPTKQNKTNKQTHNQDKTKQKQKAQKLRDTSPIKTQGVPLCPLESKITYKSLGNCKQNVLHKKLQRTLVLLTITLFRSYTFQ